MSFKNCKGQSVVETALTLPIVLLILMGIIDFSMMFNSYFVIQNASREGARIASLGATDSEIQTVITDRMYMINLDAVSTSISPDSSLRSQGSEVTVIVQYDNNIITPIISAIMPNPFQLEAKTVMRME